MKFIYSQSDCHFGPETYILTMPEDSFIARWFLIGGGILAFLGLILWVTLPIRLSLPPFLLTALLAVIYGLVCRRQHLKSKTGGKPKPGSKA